MKGYQPPNRQSFIKKLLIGSFLVGLFAFPAALPVGDAYLQDRIEAIQNELAGVGLGLKIYYILIETEKQKNVLEVLEEFLAYTANVFSENKKQTLVMVYVPKAFTDDFKDILYKFNAFTHISACFTIS